MAKSSLIISLAVASAASCFAADGVQVTPLSNNNTLVRVRTDRQPLLIFPVQESNADSKIEVIADGKVQQTFFVRLADSKVDYSVPFDLTPYKDYGSVLLNVLSEADRTHSRQAADFVCWDGLKLSESFDSSDREKYRPVYHHTPLYGWMNDPNGMFYKDGVWHLYYQYNPYGSKWQNMTWGHSTSTDLVNWTHHAPAIAPDAIGSIFSGNAVIDRENTAGFGKDAVVALYTSAAVNQVQSLAHSSDNGMTFTKYPGNPVLTTSTEARDPNMFWNPETGKWNLVLAHALDHEMLVFSSPDLVNWTQESAFGKGYDSQDGVWECPDLFPLPVDGSKDKVKWVLLCNINPGGPFGGSATQYFVGDFDGKTFKCDTPASVAKWMDFGKDHYATVSWSNAPQDRRTVIGWMSNWEYANEVPTMQFRSANTLPRDLSLFTGPDKQIYLASAPSPELLAMRGEARSWSNQTLGTAPVNYEIPSLCEIVLKLDEGSADKIDLTLLNSQGEQVLMTFDAKQKTFSMDRTRSGEVSFSKHFPAVTTAPTFQKNKQVELRLFIDRSSIEAFGQDGRFAMTNLLFPTQPYTTLSVRTQSGSAKIKSLEIYPLKK